MESTHLTSTVANYRPASSFSLFLNGS